MILTSPECLHRVDILSGLDREFEEDPNYYVVCACESLKANGTFQMWYQHSRFRNKQYHFCSALSKEFYNSVKGFPEEFNEGYAYEDDAFRAVLIQAGIKFKICDDLLTTHQWHKSMTPPNCEYLLEKNRNLFRSMFGRIN